MLVGSKFVRDFMAAKVKDAGQRDSIPNSCHLNLPLPALAKEEDSDLSILCLCQDKTLLTAEELQVLEEGTKGR